MVDVDLLINNRELRLSLPLMATLTEYYHNLTEDSSDRPAIVEQMMSVLSRAGSLLRTASGPRRSGDELLRTYQWENSVVKGLAWHPQTTKLAVAYSDNTILLYSSVSRTVPHLRHRLQRVVTAIAWKPHCSSHIAVACKERILIWNVDASFLSARPNSSTVQVLEYPGHTDISSICWSPDSSLLISSSSRDSSLHVWRLAFDSSERLSRPGIGCHHVTYSPDGQLITCLTLSNTVRIWDVASWTSDQWAHGSSDMWTACCWSCDSSLLLLTRENSSNIYSLSIRSGEQVSPPTARPIVDLQQALPQALLDRLQRFRIHDMQWDKSNSYVALLLIAHDGVSFLVVFSTHLGNLLTWHFSFKCVLEGQLGRFIIGFDFVQITPDDQAVLTVAWLSGEVRHINLTELDSNVNHQNVGLAEERASLYSTVYG